MKVAITSQNLRNVTGHAGMCRNFLLFDVSEKEITFLRSVQLAREETFHSMNKAATHPLDGVEVLISGGMGQGLFMKLTERGIRPIVTHETDPMLAVEALHNGTLQTANDALCAHHEHDDAHGEDEAHAHGCGCSCAH